MVFNLSQRPYDNNIFNGRVLEFGWPGSHSAKQFPVPIRDKALCEFKFG